MERVEPFYDIRYRAKLQQIFFFLLYKVYSNYIK